MFPDTGKLKHFHIAVVLFNDRSAVLAIIHLWRRRLRCWLVNLTTILAQWLLHFYQEPIHALQAECISRGLSIQDIITEADTNLIMNDPQTVHLLYVGVRKVQEFGARCLQTPKWKVSEWKSILRKMWQRFSKSKKLTKDIVSGLSVSLCILSSCCNIIDIMWMYLNLGTDH